MKLRHGGYQPSDKTPEEIKEILKNPPSGGSSVIPPKPQTIILTCASES